MDDPLRGARRILIDGVTGCGKTTLAARLGTVTGIRWHAIDELTWQPGWVAVPVAEQRRQITAICAAPEWILDGAGAGWPDIPLARAQLIVALDYPRWVSLYRLLRRTVASIIDQRPICNGNRDSLRQVFSGESIVVWHFRSFQRKRDRLRRWCADPAAPPVLLLRTPRQARRWLTTLVESHRPCVIDDPDSQPRDRLTTAVMTTMTTANTLNTRATSRPSYMLHIDLGTRCSRFGSPAPTGAPMPRVGKVCDRGRASPRGDRAGRSHLGCLAAA